MPYYDVTQVIEFTYRVQASDEQYALRVVEMEPNLLCWTQKTLINPHISYGHSIDTSGPCIRVIWDSEVLSDTATNDNAETFYIPLSLIKHFEGNVANAVRYMLGLPVIHNISYDESFSELYDCEDNEWEGDDIG